MSVYVSFLSRDCAAEIFLCRVCEYTSTLSYIYITQCLRMLDSKESENCSRGGEIVLFYNALFIL